MEMIVAEKSLPFTMTGRSIFGWCVILVFFKHNFVWYVRYIFCNMELNIRDTQRRQGKFFKKVFQKVSNLSDSSFSLFVEPIIVFAKEVVKDP